MQSILLTSCCFLFAHAVGRSSWEPQLSLLRRDCSHYTIALVQHLTGKQLSRADLLL